MRLLPGENFGKPLLRMAWLRRRAVSTAGD
jgi:hypothetical protein